MKLRLETGNFNIKLVEGSTNLPKDLKPEDLIGAIITYSDGDMVYVGAISGCMYDTVDCTVACFATMTQDSSMNPAIYKFLYNALTGSFTAVE